METATIPQADKRLIKANLLGKNFVWLILIFLRLVLNLQSIHLDLLSQCVGLQYNDFFNIFFITATVLGITSECPDKYFVAEKK